MNGTYVSLFSGIGGLDLAVEVLGFTCAGQVEWDRHCAAVLDRWWPGVPRWGDVASYPGGDGRESHAESNGEPKRPGIEAPRRADAHGRIDLIIGGFPCQPASTAGRRKGTADDRWLWPEFARITGELRPRLLLVENVPGLLTVNGGRAFSEVLGDLAALGYDATWRSVRASDVGAPHRRERIFLLASDGNAHGDELGTGGSGLVGRRNRGPAPHADHGRHESLLRSPSLPGVREEERRTEPRSAGGRAATDAEDDGRERQGGPRDGRTGPSDFRWGPYDPAIRRWERTLNRAAPDPVDDKGRLAPPFVEWMQGFPEGWTDHMSRTQALKALGNAVVPQQGAAALAALFEMVAEDVEVQT